MRVILFAENYCHLRYLNLFSMTKVNTGENPKEWPFANIYPLFKKGNRALACYYRPVSLTCVSCKLLEHTVCSNIMAHLDEYELLSDRQRAFRKKSWTKEDRLTYLYWTSRRFLTPRHMNFLKANYLVMASVERHAGGPILFFFFFFLL